MTLQVGAGEYILDVALRAGLALPHTCLQGWCLTCAGRVIRGETDQSDSFRFYAADREAGFALLCTAKPRSPLCIETHARAAMVRHRVQRGLPAPSGAGWP